MKYRPDYEKLAVYIFIVVVAVMLWIGLIELLSLILNGKTI